MIGVLEPEVRGGHGSRDTTLDAACPALALCWGGGELSPSGGTG